MVDDRLVDLYSGVRDKGQRTISDHHLWLYSVFAQEPRGSHSSRQAENRFDRFPKKATGKGDRIADLHNDFRFNCPRRHRRIADALVDPLKTAKSVEDLKSAQA